MLQSYIRASVFRLAATITLLFLFSSYSVSAEAPVSTPGYISPQVAIDPTTRSDFEPEDGARYGLTFGKDNREPMPNKGYPWSAIGRSVNDSGFACTGSLVARDLVLTNAHCVMLHKNGQLTKKVVEPDQINFFPDYTEHNTGPASQAIAIHVSPEYLRGDRSNDWAILRLSSPIGDSHGWLGIVPSRDEPHVTGAGYSGDIRRGEIATIDRTCRTWAKEGNDRVFHNCDDWQGSSGGPLFRENNGEYSIVALNSADYIRNKEVRAKKSQLGAREAEEFYRQVGELEYYKDGVNLAVQTQRFAAKVKELTKTSSRKQGLFVNLCNDLSEKVSYGIARMENRRWQTKGWKGLAPGHCREISFADGSNQPYIHAWSSTSNLKWEGDRSFCTKQKGPFTLSGSDRSHCSDRSDSFMALHGAEPGRLNVFRFSRENSLQPTVVKLCNKSGYSKIYAAYAYRRDGSLNSHGWQKITRGRCSTIKLPDGYTGKFYYYGEMDGRHYTGYKDICVDDSNAFNLRKADDRCSGRNMKYVEFDSMSIAAGQTRTLTLR